MGPLVAVSCLYLGTALVGTAVAVAEGLSGAPFGLSTGLAPALDFAVGLGTALSAPLVLLVAFAALLGLSASRRDEGRTALAVVALLGAGFLAGMLAEPITYRVLSPGGFRTLPAALVVANLVLPALVVALARRERSERRRRRGEQEPGPRRYTGDGP